MSDLVKVISKYWGWTGIEPVHVAAQNDFGNLLVQDADGRFWRICPEDLYCNVVAESVEEVQALVQTEEFEEDWLMTRLVNLAVEEYGSLKDGFKFYLVTPGPLGGAYSVENIRSAPTEEVIGLSGDIANQIKDLPDGAQVEIKVQ